MNTHTVYTVRWLGDDGKVIYLGCNYFDGADDAAQAISVHWGKRAEVWRGGKMLKRWNAPGVAEVPA
jgi:hypothetical protein